MARRAICTGVWPAIRSAVSTPTCLPGTARLLHRRGTPGVEGAISILRRICSLRRRAILAVVVVQAWPHHHDRHRRRGIEVDRVWVEPSVSMSGHGRSSRSSGRGDRLHHLDPDSALAPVDEGAPTSRATSAGSAGGPRDAIDIGRGQRAAARTGRECRTVCRTGLRTSNNTSECQTTDYQTTASPGARCRALTSGLTGPGGEVNYGSFRELET